MTPETENAGRASLTVAEALVLALRDWGVGSVFGVSGANIEDFHDAVYRLGEGEVVSVAAKTESGAAFMADAQARAGEPLGVCCSTSGGGMMNLAVGVAESYQEGIPVLAIVGQIPTGLNGVGGFQDSSGIGHTVNAKGLWSAISKEVRVISNPETFWTDLREVVESILSPRPGPGVLLIAKNVFSLTVPPRPADWPTDLSTMRACRQPRPSMLRDLIERLGRAKAPLIVAGPDVRAGGAQDQFVTLARRMQIPVVTTLSDIGAFPADDPLCLGVIGTAGHPSAHRYVNEVADLVIVVGSSLEIMQRAPVMDGLGRAELVFVCPEVSLCARTFPEATLIESDVLAFTTTLLCDAAMLPVGPGRPMGYVQQEYQPLIAARTEVDHHPNSEGALLQSEAIAKVQQILPHYQRLLFDAGNCAASALHYLSVPAHVQTSIALGMGGMGYAIPGAIGASLAGSEAERTMVLCGDGAFLMLGMEVHTVVDLGLPILFVVFNNAKHGMCVTRQQVYFQSRIECASYDSVAVAELCRGFGTSDQIWVGEASTLADLDAALDELSDWQWSGPAVLELTLRREEVPPFAPFLPADAPVIDKPAEGHALPISSPFRPRAA